MVGRLYEYATVNVLENGCLLPRDLLESGIGKEDKAMKKLQSVLARLEARQAHQASLYQEAKAQSRATQLQGMSDFVRYG